MERIIKLQELSSQRYPVLTVSNMIDIATECNVSYSTIVSYVNHCRFQKKNMGYCLQKLMHYYRPDLPNFRVPEKGRRIH